MPRPRKPRCVREESPYGFFKPHGVPLGALEVVSLSVEELEALRLADVEGLYQEGAAEHMEISRPTFHRVLKQAHRKVATALVEGKALGIEGGTTSSPGKPAFSSAWNVATTGRSRSEAGRGPARRHALGAAGQSQGMDVPEGVRHAGAWTLETGAVLGWRQVNDRS